LIRRRDIANGKKRDIEEVDRGDLEPHKEGIGDGTDA